MKTKIKDIADISTGYQFRKGIEHDPNGLYQVIQIKNINQFNRLDLADSDRVALDSVSEHHLLKQGDVLFISKGQRNIAIPITEPIGAGVAASMFFVLRVTKDVLPEYLAWYINQKAAQEYLANKARRGSHIPIIAKSVFDELIVEVPVLKDQQTIVKLYRLLQKESYLLDKIKEKRKVLIEAIILKRLQNELIPRGE